MLQSSRLDYLKPDSLVTVMMVICSVMIQVVMAVDMVRELSDPMRDYKKFDYKKRAHELFMALDEDGSGGITETEYVKGCKSDKYFVKLLTELSQDFIWGYNNEE